MAYLAPSAELFQPQCCKFVAPEAHTQTLNYRFDMAKLIYSTICSLDEYVVDKNGKFDWAAPDEEVHAFVNDLEREIGTYLYGRRIYEVMTYWETHPTEGDEPPVMRDYAKIWQSAEKIVFSRTLTKASTAKTRIERSFDPDSIAKLKEESSRDISVGGAELAGEAITAGLVDELHFFLHPIVVGGGRRALPDGTLVRLELLDEWRFKSGVVHLHYRVKRQAPTPSPSPHAPDTPTST